MINFLNKKVKFYLVNSLVSEGFVTMQSDSLIELSNVNNNSKLYINNPNNNIIMYLVYQDEVESDKEDTLLTSLNNQDNKIKKILKKKIIDQKIIEEKPLSSLTDVPLNNEELSSLILQKNQIEKELIRKKLLNKNIELQETVYGTISQLNDFDLTKKTSI